MSWPPFPWRLRPAGPAFGTVHAVDAAAARALVPRPFRIVKPWPGRTLGGLFLVRYGPGSAVEYNELVACAGVVLHEGRPCAWVSHVFVDDATSLRGGREGLGVPKQMARFEASGAETTVVAADGVVCTIRCRRPLRLWRSRFRFRAAHLDVRDDTGSCATVHGNEIAGRIVAGRAEVRIPVGSPLRVLGLGRPLLAAGLVDAEALFGGAPFLPARTIALDA
ncbi:MAG TPA: acetoacetate decarboxylase family protein [Longimicrobiales bacterium]